MDIEHYSIEKLKREISTIVGKYLDLQSFRIFFFGSRVQGVSNERSDIDVGIEGPVAVPSAILLDIQEEIENIPILNKIEVVDFKHTSSEFRAVALHHIEPIA